MNRIIESQLIASTRVDRNGNRIEPERLRELCALMPDPMPSAAHHDMSSRPPAILHRRRIVELEDGELAIVGDVEIFDEELFASCGGFSIAFAGKVFRIGGDEDEEPIVQITANPRQFDVEGIVQLALPFVDEGVVVDVAERIEKQWGEAETIAIIGLAYQVVQDKRLHDLIRNLYRRIRGLPRIDHSSGTTHVHLHIHLPDRQSAAVIRIDPNAGDTALDNVDPVELGSRVREELDTDGGIRVVGSINASGEVAFDFVIRPDGTTRRAHDEDHD